MSQFFTDVMEARFDFATIGEYIKNTIDTLKANTAISSLWEAGLAALAAVLPYLAVVFLALSLVETFFGKKLIDLQKILASFVIGFVLGVQFISPLVDTVFVLEPWIVGLVVGGVALVTYKVIYFLAVVACSGYPVYFVCYTAAYLPEVTVYTKGNLMYSAIAAAVAIVLVLLLLKYVEILGTAILGGYFSALCIRTMYDFTTLEFLVGYETLSFYVVVGFIALLGFAFQFKTRRRY